MDKIALFGYSGHALVIADAVYLQGNAIVGYFDKSKSLTNPFNLHYLGYEDDGQSLLKIKNLGIKVFVSIGDNVIRQKICMKLLVNEFESSTVIHPKSTISRLADLNSGCYVAPGVLINALAEIGEGTIINTGAVVEHECKVGKFAHIGPGAVIAGNVNIGDGSFVGANAVIKQGITVGKNVIIGAGSVVLKNIPDNQIWVGNPANRLRNG